MTDEKHWINGIDPFAIDPNRLDMEWLRQPEAYHREAVKLADLRKRLEMAKADRDVTVAEAAQGVRRNPAAYGLEKVTEAGVNEVVTMRCRNAEQKVIDAKHDHDVQQAMIDSLDHRKKALEDLVRLRLASYYAEPNMPAGVPPEKLAAVARHKAPTLEERVNRVKTKIKK